jgi:hypothetical protein
MGVTHLGRWGAVLLTVAATALAGAAVGPVAPAHAGGSPVRVAQPSAHDQSPSKTVTASCPGGTTALAAGARVLGGDGGVVLTGMVPDPALSSVTATAAARTGHLTAWTLVAYAICDQTASPVGRVATTVAGSATATTSCPGQSRLTGTGFRLQGSVDYSYPDEVWFGPGLQQVRVHAAGPGTPGSVTAFAICLAPSAPAGTRVSATSDHDSAWPKLVTVGDPAGGPESVYGVGAAVEGGANQVFLTALVPSPDQHLALAEASRARPLPGGQLAGAARFAAAGQDGEESGAEGSVTVFGILIGTFH